MGANVYTVRAALVISTQTALNIHQSIVNIWYIRTNIFKLCNRQYTIWPECLDELTSSSNGIGQRKTWPPVHSQTSRYILAIWSPSGCSA